MVECRWQMGKLFGYTGKIKKMRKKIVNREDKGEEELDDFAKIWVQ